ncbi:MAG: VanW family protein [Deltaproteobacteria bacterium]|nr:VanW family protein [Deltaproteobacteria bacterium]
MTQPTGTRSKQHGAVLFGLAGGMLVTAAGLLGGYYVLGTKSEAIAATTEASSTASAKEPAAKTPTATPAGPLGTFLDTSVTLKVAGQPVTVTWAELGVEPDPDEIGRSPVTSKADLASLGGKGLIPVRLDREKAVAKLLELKASYDRAPSNAFLDLEARAIHADKPGMGLDVWGSLPRIEGAARQGAAALELIDVPVPAVVTKANLGIEDISQVLGYHVTKFPVTDRDRNFNLKLAASKINGYVMKPGEEWSFNGVVGERSQKMGYKIAHVITSGEMVDGLAGGTCQISTTLFGAAFFAGLDIVDTRNHSRPSTYTPLGFDATVVWPDTDLKLKNPYDFPVALRYVVANGEAKVEVLGKKRPYDKVVFERRVLETTPYSTEERLDEEVALDTTSIDQAGFDGYKLERFRRFYKNGKVVKTNKWTVNYKPVTEYIRRGTNPDPEAKPAVAKESHGPKVPSSDTFSMAQ